MITRTWLTGVALVIVVVCGASLHAQSLRAGTWTGTAAGPDGASTDVTFAVKRSGVWAPDATRVIFPLSITFDSGQGALPLENVQLDGDTLSYRFTIDGVTEVSCSLTRQEDGGYSGPCDAGGGTTGRHTG